MSETKNSTDHDSRVDGTGTSPQVAHEDSAQASGARGAVSITVRSRGRVPNPRELALDTSYGPIRGVISLFVDSRERKRDEVYDAVGSRNVAAKAIRSLVSLGFLHRNGYLALTDRGKAFLVTLGGPSEEDEFRKALIDYAPFRHLYTHIKETCSADGFTLKEALDSWMKALMVQGDSSSARGTIRGSLIVFLNLARESGLLSREGHGAPYTFGRSGAVVPVSRGANARHGRRREVLRPSVGAPSIPTYDPKIQLVLKEIVRAAIHSADPRLKRWAVVILDSEGLSR